MVNRDEIPVQMKNEKNEAPSGAPSAEIPVRVGEEEGEAPIQAEVDEFEVRRAGHSDAPRTIPCSSCQVTLAVPALTYEWNCREAACMAARVSNPPSLGKCSVCGVRRDKHAPCDNVVMCSKCNATTVVPSPAAPGVFNQVREGTSSIIDKAKAGGHAAAGAGRAMVSATRRLFAPPVFCRCPHCVVTIAVPPPASLPVPGEEGAAPVARTPDRRIMSCPHCNGTFRVPSTVIWEQLMYIGTRLKMMVVVVWDKIINSWGYMFKEAPSTFKCVKCLRQLSASASSETVLCAACGYSNVPPRSRATNTAITSKVWTERKLRKLFYRLRKQPCSNSASAGNDDVKHDGNDDSKHDAPPPSVTEAKPELENAAESSDSEVEEMVRSIEEESQDPAPVEPAPVEMVDPVIVDVVDPVQMVDPVIIDVVDPVSEAPVVIAAEQAQAAPAEAAPAEAAPAEATPAEAAPAEAALTPAEANPAPAEAAPAPAEASPVEAAAEEDLVIVEQQPFEDALTSLCAMGFSDRDRNLPLLREYNGDVNAVVNALLA